MYFELNLHRPDHSINWKLERIWTQLETHKKELATLNDEQKLTKLKSKYDQLIEDFQNYLRRWKEL